MNLADIEPAYRLQTGQKFLESFKPFESIVDGLPIARGSVVSVTGPTGHGKTTLAALLEVCLCTGRPFAGRDVTRGSVLVLAGENPDDYAMHLAATVQDMAMKPRDLREGTCGPQLFVIAGTFDVAYERDWLAHQLSVVCDELVAVFVDTSAAFNLGSDENDNLQMRAHASTMRELTRLPGNPAVIVLSHPVKNAQADNLLPRGGGAFLAEVDANLTVWKDSAGIVTLHWAGKIRGPSFEAVRFELAPVELEGKRDSRGRPILSVAARHVADERVEQLEAKETDDEDRLLVALQRTPGASLRDLAMACGWTNGSGKPLAARVDRRLKVLADHKLVEQDRRGKWRLTSRGTNEANRLP